MSAQPLSPVLNTLFSPLQASGPTEGRGGAFISGLWNGMEGPQEDQRAGCPACRGQDGGFLALLTGEESAVPGLSMPDDTGEVALSEEAGVASLSALLSQLLGLLDELTQRQTGAAEAGIAQSGQASEPQTDHLTSEDRLAQSDLELLQQLMMQLEAWRPGQTLPSGFQAAGGEGASVSLSDGVLGQDAQTASAPDFRQLLKMLQQSLRQLTEVDTTVRQAQQERGTAGDSFNNGVGTLNTLVENAQKLIQRLLDQQSGSDRKGPEAVRQTMAALSMAGSMGGMKHGAEVHQVSARGGMGMASQTTMIANMTGAALEATQPVTASMHVVSGKATQAGLDMNKSISVQAESHSVTALMTAMAAPEGMEAQTESGMSGFQMGAGDPRASAGTALAPITVPLRHPDWSQALAQRLMLMAQNQQNVADIRLHPAHLGPIRVRMDMDQDGGVQISLQAHHALTREAMEAALPRLRTLFEEQQLALKEVNVGGQEGFSQHMQGRHAHDGQADHSFSGPTVPMNAEDNPSSGPESASGVRVSNRLVSYVV